MNLAKLKDRISKLLALSKCNGATEGEADNATEKAMQLMVEHHLTELDITQSPESVTRQDFVESIRELWPALIWTATAKLYMCRHYRASIRTHSYHILVGTHDNILIASQMAQRFVEITKQASLQHAEQGRAFISSFKKGFASRLNNRLLDRLKAAKQQTYTQTTGTSLSLAPQYAKAERDINEFIRAENMNRGVKTKRVGGSSSLSGVEAGRKAAENVALGGHIKNQTHLSIY